MARNTRNSGKQKFFAVGEKVFEFVYQKESGSLTSRNFDNIEIVTGPDDIQYILYENKKYPIEVLEKNQNKYVVMINGVSYSFTVETDISLKRKKLIQKVKGKQKSEILRAPMPGKIIEIYCEPEESVKKGDSLLVLEAMKMQNEILSDHHGSVKKVLVKEGDVVNKDDELIEITIS